MQERATLSRRTARYCHIICIHIFIFPVQDIKYVGRSSKYVDISIICVFF